MLEMDRQELIERTYEQRLSWLEEHSASSYDVLTDELGDEYIISENESGTPGDSYQFDTRRVYLPVHLQKENINLGF